MRFFLVGVLIVSSFSKAFSLDENCGRTQHPLGLVKCGNEDTRPGDFPWLVGIFNKEKRKFICNGHLISKRHVISDSDYISDKFQSVHYSLFHVIVGQHNLKSAVDDSQKFGVRKIHKPNNVDWYLFYKFLILTLENSVTFSETVQPICLSDSTCVDCGGILVRLNNL